MAEGFRIGSAFVDVHLQDDTLADEAKIKARIARSGPAEIRARVDIGDAERDLNKLSVTGGRVFSPLVAAGIAAGTILGGPLALGAIPFVFGGVAAAILSKNELIKDSFSQLGHGILDDLRTDTQPLVPYFQGIAGKIGTSFQEVRPQLRGVFTDLGPELDTLTTGVLRFATNAMPGFVTAIHSGQPVMQGLSDLLAKTGTGLSGFFTQLSTGSAASGQVFSQLGTIIGQVLPVVGQLVAVFAQFTSGALPVLSGTLGTALGLLSQLLGVLGPIAPVLGQITGYVLSAVSAFKLFGAVGGAVEGLGGKLAGIATSAGTMTTSLTGSASAGEKLASAGSKVESALTKVGSALPVIGVALVGAGLAYDQMRSKSDELSASVLAGSQSFAQAVSEEAVQIGNRDRWFGTYVGGMDSAVRAQHAYAEATQNVTTAIAGELATMGPLQRAQAEAALAQGQYNDAVVAFGPGSAQASFAAGTLAAATDRVKQAQFDAAQATKSMTDRVIEQTSILAGAANADVAYQQSLLAVQAAQKAADDASRQYGATSQQTQSAVLSLEQQVLSAAEAAKRKAEADNASLGPQAQARAGSDAYANALVNLAAQATGPARNALLGYVGNLDSSQLAAISASNATSGFGTKVIQLPNGKTVTIIADTGQALGAIGGVQGALAGLRDKYVRVVVNTVQNIAAGIPHAQGGVFPMASGGVLSATSFAGGGFKSMSSLRAATVPPGDLRIIGDNQRYTELYAPLDGSKRSLSFIRYGAQQFGYDLAPAGRGRGREPLRKEWGPVTVNVTQASGSPAETGRFVALALRGVG